jgi:hypothetical protein
VDSGKIVEVFDQGLDGVAVECDGEADALGDDRIRRCVVGGLASGEEREVGIGVGESEGGDDGQL